MTQRILSFIGWLGTALVVVGAAVGFVPALDRYAPYMRPLAIAGLVCLLAYMLGQWRELGQMFGRRQARYGALAGASTLIVLGILIAINYIGKTEHKRWDLTASKQFSLSDQTRNVVAKLDAPLKMHAFPAPPPSPDYQRYQDQLHEYEVISKKVSGEVIDLDTKPEVARQYQVQ